MGQERSRGHGGAPDEPVQQEGAEAWEEAPAWRGDVAEGRGWDGGRGPVKVMSDRAEKHNYFQAVFMKLF